MKKNLVKPATLHDVAELAGVSHITVSRVVNGKQNVAPETRERVQQAMQELGYVPNLAAQTLQTGRSRVIEMITTDIGGSDASVIFAVNRRAREQGYHVSILPITLNELPQTLGAIPNRMVAGTILYVPNVEADYRLIAELTYQYPFVQIVSNLHSGLPSVCYDNDAATRLGIQYLIKMGHRRIATITGSQSIWDGKVRYEAWRDTLIEHGLEPGPVAFGNFGIESGVAAMQALLPRLDEFTAIFVASDRMAVGALHVLHQNGYRVPDDISILGYDNADYAPYLFPPLTTLENNRGVLGEMAVSYLFEQIENVETIRDERTVQSRLIERESVRIKFDSPQTEG